MTDWTDDLADIIAGQFPAVDIYFEYLDPNVKNCIVLKTEPGTGDTYYSGGKSIYRGAVLLNVRNIDLETAKSIAQDLSNYLRLITNRSQGNTFFERISCNGYYHVKSSNQEGNIYSINIDVKYQR